MQPNGVNGSDWKQIKCSAVQRSAERVVRRSEMQCNTMGCLLKIDNERIPREVSQKIRWHRVCLLKLMMSVFLERCHKRVLVI